MNKQDYMINDISGKDSDYSFFDLMVDAGQMQPEQKEEIDFSAALAFLSKFKISRPRNLGGAVAA